MSLKYCSHLHVLFPGDGHRSGAAVQGRGRVVRGAGVGGGRRAGGGRVTGHGLLLLLFPLFLERAPQPPTERVVRRSPQNQLHARVAPEREQAELT